MKQKSDEAAYHTGNGTILTSKNNSIGKKGHGAGGTKTQTVGASVMTGGNFDLSPTRMQDDDFSFMHKRNAAAGF